MGAQDDRRQYTRLIVHNKYGIIFYVIIKTNVMDRNQDDKKRNQSEEDRDLPGYPHYPPEEDIMNPQLGLKKIHADEELANSRSLSSRIVNSKEESGEITGADDDQ